MEEWRRQTVAVRAQCNRYSPRPYEGGGEYACLPLQRVRVCMLVRLRVCVCVCGRVMERNRGMVVPLFLGDSL